ncbi:hypothetical protein MPTK2_3g10200 [Marchantia polymorpha subsp. ruderalis]
MGSLMAGWQTNQSDSRQIVKRSTSSMTNSEVQRFWRSKESSVRRHIRYVDSRQETADLEATDNNRSDSESSSPPTTPLSSSLPASYNGEKTGWWTRSTSAFLNEPPQVENKHSRYKPQFDIFEICGSASLVKRRNSLSALVLH